MFIGDKGRLFVNRGKAYGKPVEELAQNPLPADAVRLYQSDDHMRNFFECVKDRSLPVSDVFSHANSVNACHMANIAMLLGRKVRFDPKKQSFPGDPEANALMGRKQRAPYTIRV